MRLTSHRGASRTANAPSRFENPGIAIALPRRNARCPTRAALSADIAMDLKRFELSMFAFAMNSVAVGPGQKHVAVTPVPRSSPCM
mgnify:CR=1 FL=1